MPKLKNSIETFWVIFKQCANTITQPLCNLLIMLPFRADADCFQYYTGVSGSVQSLNYPNVALDDVVYTACVRRESGFCGIQWSEAASPSPDSFILDGTLTVGEAVKIELYDCSLQVPSLYTFSEYCIVTLFEKSNFWPKIQF